ncbi:hypothetical protein ABZP36_010783 [Zizania latifolia]
MICVDNSEWMRNCDYPPSRFLAQADAVNLVCGVKTESNPENTVGLMAMAGKDVRVLVAPTSDVVKILFCMHGLEVEGEANLTAAIQVAQLALKHRQNKNQHQRIVVFVGSPVRDEKNVLEEIGKKLKRNNVSLDVVDFGESDDRKPEKLEALVAAVNSGGNSHIIHVPPGKTALSDVLISSPIITGEDEGSASAAAASGASRFEFGVDPELALVLRLSVEDERARQEAAAKKDAEESSKAETKGESSTSDTGTVMAEAEIASNTSLEDMKCKLKDEIDLLRKAQEMLLEVEENSGKDTGSETANAADCEMSDGASDDMDLTLALQLSIQKGKTGAQSSKVFEDQSSVTSIIDSVRSEA